MFINRIKRAIAATSAIMLMTCVVPTAYAGTNPQIGMKKANCYSLKPDLHEIDHAEMHDVFVFGDGIGCVCNYMTNDAAAHVYSFDRRDFVRGTWALAHIQLPAIESQSVDTSKENQNAREINTVEVEDAMETVEEPVETFGDTVVDIAKAQLGKPYVWGGTTPKGFDCSGFVYYVINKAGYSLSRSMSEQYKAGEKVKKNDLTPGDLVFFKNTYKSGMSHVGIYVGDGKFIHSPRSGKTVSYSDIDSGYYASRYYGACRISK